jgi:hypothetical protein
MAGESVARKLESPALSWRDWRPVFVAGVLALVLGGGLIAVFDGISPYERTVGLEGLTSTVLWLAASLIGSCSTIAALMLTTVGLLEHLETDRLTPRFLFHLRLVVTAAIFTIGFAVLTLLLTVFPTSTTASVAPSEFQVNLVYWTLLVATALSIAGFTTVLGALYTTVHEVFRTLPPTWIEEILTEEPSAD